MEKTISVVIPTYNRAHLIRRAVESVKSQTYKNITQIIIVDDGSKDETEKVIKEIKDLRIRYIKLNQNHGAGYARNRGMEASTGDYIAFCDSDDYWVPEKLEKQMQYMEITKADMCFHAIERVFQSGEKEIIPDGFETKEAIELKDIIPVNKASTQTYVLTKKCAKMNQFDEELPSLEDWEYAVRLVAGGYKVSYYNEVLCTVERQNDSISNNMENGFWAMNKILVQLMRKYNEQNRGSGGYKQEEEDELQKAVETIRAMENSTSWRITVPIRKIGYWLNKIRGREEN